MNRLHTTPAIQRHPTDDVLLKYVSGHYDTAYSLVLATHISQCVCCQNSVALHQEIGGAALHQAKPAEMKMSAMDLLDQAEEPEAIRFPTLKADHSETFDLDTPNILSTYLNGSLDEIKWQRLSKDIKQYVIKTEGQATARLIWMAPGKAVPPHGHQGEEMTMILSGGYYDGDEAFTAGDLHIADHKSPHVPTAMEDQPCLVLAATDKPLIFSGIIPKILQPFFRI